MSASAGPERAHVRLAAGRNAMGNETSERLYLTIAFSDISGSTAIAAAMEPEFYADLLERIRAICDEVIPRHEGMIVRIDGDGIASLFGYPVPQEDSGRRAVEAALDLHRAIAGDPLLNTDDAPIQLHTGIHAGMVLVRSGDLLRGRFEMLGDATNVAKRLCDAARPGEVVVSDSTTGGEIAAFIVESSEHLRLAGRAAPIRIHRVSGRARVRRETRSRHMRTPFVGRRDERTQLVRWARDSTADVPVAAIVGPPGLGKTRLASEVLAHLEAEGYHVHRAYCDGHVGAAPMQPIIQLLESIERAPSA
ncbi:MAG: hypothetical protein JWQ16_2429, partial [Novosphingobium sp.]|nr:hypothetical protein [Novosphingobium sp.]